MGRPKKSTFGIFSILRPIFSIAVLSAFVLGISFLVKTAASSNSGSFLATISPILSRFNIDASKFGGLNKTTPAVSTVTPQPEPEKVIEKTTNRAVAENVNFSIAILADSHSSYDNLDTALDMAKEAKVTYTFFLGDYTDLGISDDLQQAKEVMDRSDLDYSSLPGDHDLWKSVGPQNFIDVFGKNYFTKTINGIKFVGLDNSANYTLISTEQMAWFKKELAGADFVLLSQPLYHPSSGRVMGTINGEQNAEVHAQAQEILKMIRESEVKAVIAGDLHMSSQNKDPEKPKLMHYVVGALTDERNLQTPRFAMFKALKQADDLGDYAIEDVLLQ
jgi:predicted phosphodiesterase